MADIILFILLLSIAAFVVGLIKPSLVLRWGPTESRTRKKVALTFGGAAIVLLFMFGITDDRETAQLVNSLQQDRQVMEQANTSNESSAFKLASLEIGHNSPPQASVNKFQGLLNELAIKCPDESEAQIAGYIFVGQEKIEEEVGPITLFDVGKGISGSIPEGTEGITTCAEIAAAFVTLTISN